ncbi:MAG: Gfo/Idh/MocA family oxidoreductase [Spirochaetales bacterium]|nr:MAG: Gfo/Idh/MocA family oxidoreductase [Spirochaetales bacterium]
MKIKWGILGNAKIAREQVIPAMQKGEYAVIAALASRDLAKARDTAESLGIHKVFGTYEELLDDDSINAVYIPLPNHLHVEWSIKAMEAGKHVLCEKPFALATEDVRKVMKVRDKTGMKIGEAFMMRCHPQWIRARELVRSGELGNLRAIQGFFSYFNRDPLNIRNIAGMGGGGIWDIGCYPVNTSRFLFGEEPRRVVALIENDPGFGVDRLASAILDYPSGQAVFVSSTQVASYQRMLAVGTKKHLEIEIPFNSPVSRPTQIFTSDTFSRDSERELITIDTSNQYTLQGDAFSKAIIDDTEVPVPLEDTLKNTAVLTALYRSAGSGGWEKVTV